MLWDNFRDNLLDYIVHCGAILRGASINNDCLIVLSVEEAVGQMLKHFNALFYPGMCSNKEKPFPIVILIF